MTERFVETLIRRKWVLIALMLVAVGALGVGAGPWFKADNSVRVWFLEGDSALMAYDEFQAQFGNDEVVIIAVSDPDGVFSPDALARIRAASNRIEKVDKIHKVTSITIGRHIDGDAVEIRTEPLLDDGPIDEAAAAAVRERVAANPAFQGTLIGPDDRMTLIVAQMETVEDIDYERPAVLDEIRKIAKEELNTGDGQSFLGGIGLIYDELNRAVLHDTSVFIGLSYVVILAGLGLIFRRWVWVLLGMAIITLATVASVGVFGVLGRKMNMVTSIMPTLIMTVGIMDLVHLIEAYQEGRPADGGAISRKRLVASLAIVITPCIFNTVTDAIGFLALATAKLGAVRDFGLLAAAGLAILLSISLVLAVPVFARFAGKPAPRRRVGGGALLWVVERLTVYTARHRRAVLGFGAGLAVLAVVGVTMLRVDTYTIEFLDQDHRARRDHEQIQSQFGYYIPLEFTVRAKAEGGVQDPELLRKIERMERAFEKDARISRTTGLPEIVKRINQVVMDGEDGEYRIPDTRAAVAQELLLYEMDADNELSDVVDNDMTLTRVTTIGGMTTARKLQAGIEDLTAIARAELGDDAEITPTGYLPLYTRIVEYVTLAQVTSFSLAFGLVAVMLMVLLRSFRLGLVALVPNLLPTAMTLGLMGALDIRLDVGTVLLASIAIGISVNDTSHLMFRFKEELADTGGDARLALERTMHATGRAVLASSLLLMAGFGVLGFATTTSISNFGLLSAATVLSAVVADLVITPALLLTVRFPGLTARTES